MRAAVGIVAAMAAAAQAQPVAAPCTVQVQEAPDAVRAEIERWVRAEPRCERQLAVRVTQVRGGLHLVATGSDGRVRERVVPDASSVAVLVVSWMADNSIDDALDATKPVEAAPVKLPAAPAPAPALDTESPVAPEIRVRVPPRMLRHRWLSFGASAGETVGMHAQVDLLARGRWTFGVATGLHQDDERMRHDDVAGDATLFVACTQPVGPIDLRAQIGVGAELRDDRMESESFDPKAQAGVFVRLRVGEDWGVLGGPLLDADLDGQAVDVSAFGGVERRW
jgi:hypothetical protein